MINYQYLNHTLRQQMTDRLRPVLLRNAEWISWILLLSALSGCGGGGVDQNDMMQYAKHRPTEAEEEGLSESPAVATNNPATPATAPAAVVNPANSTASNQNTSPAQASSTIHKSTQTTANATANGTHAQLPSKQDSNRGATPLATDGDSTHMPDQSAKRITDPVEQRKQTIENMKQIATALEQYREENNTYPPFAIHSTAGKPLLSWRVALLPYLGYEDLYRKFNTTQPWNGSTNKRLLEWMPDVYRALHRWDERTNYQYIYASGATGFGRRPSPPRLWEDGLENTVILVETDDDAAAIWTQPTDYNYQSRFPRQSLGSLRPDGFFVIWGGGEVRRVKPDVTDQQLRAMFSMDGGETIDRYIVSVEPNAKISTQPVTSTANATLADQSASPTTSAPSNTAANMSASSGMSKLGSQLREDVRKAWKNGNVDEALQTLDIMYSADLANAADDYFWASALRRPVRWISIGMGGVYVGQDHDQVISAQESDSPAARGKWLSVVGDLGSTTLATIQEHVEKLPAFLDQSSPEQSNDLSTTRWIGWSSERQLLRVAQQEALDVLVIFDVHEGATSTGKAVKTTAVSLWDVRGRRKLFKSDPVNSIKRKLSLRDITTNDPLKRIEDELRFYCRDQFSKEPIPESLRSTHARRRVAWLVNSLQSPLQDLAEIKFYYTKQLLSTSELLAAYRSVLGDQKGPLLLAGKPHEKLDILRNLHRNAL